MSALEEIGAEITKAVSAPPDAKNLPPVSMSMVDVSARLTALEDAVKELKKAVLPPPADRPIETTNILPSGTPPTETPPSGVSPTGGARNRRRKTRRQSKKTRSRK